MQLLIHSYQAFAITFSIFLASLIALYFLWYRKLPATNVGETNKMS